jgi:hypothetical protein
MSPAEIGNPLVPNGFGKYQTQTYPSPSGNFVVHFYYNPSTSQAFYDIDYKINFSKNFGK